MFPDLRKAIELLERLVVAVERIANAEENRAQAALRGEAERVGEDPDQRVHVRHIAENGVAPAQAVEKVRIRTTYDT